MVTPCQDLMDAPLALLLWARARRESIPLVANLRMWAGSGLCAVLLLAASGTIIPSAASLQARIGQARQAWSFVWSRTGAASLWRSGLLAAMNEYPGLAEVSAAVQGQTATAWPWDGNAILAAGGQEGLAPTPQGYSAYEPALDRRDARFFSSPTRPAVTLVTAEAIDGRLPLQSAPATLRAILACYAPVQVSGMFVLSKSRPCITEPSRALGPTRTVATGQWVKVPPVPDTLVYAHLTVRPSGLGSLLGLLFRRAPVYIHIETVNGHTYTYRLVAATAPEGILVSSLLESAWDVFRLWQGISPEQARQISVTTTEPAAWQGSVRLAFTAQAVVPGDAAEVGRIVSALQRCLPARQRTGTTRALQVMAGIYLDRPDLQAAFGPPARVDLQQLLEWTANSGVTRDWQKAALQPFAAVYRRLVLVPLGGRCSGPA